MHRGAHEEEGALKPRPSHPHSAAVAQDRRSRHFAKAQRTCAAPDHSAAGAQPLLPLSQDSCNPPASSKGKRG